MNRLVGAAQSRPTVAALLLLATFVLLHAGSMQRRTLTIDESGHYAYGWRLLHFNSRRVDPLYDNSKMPFSMLNALPRAIAEAALPPGALRRHLETIEFSRYVTVLCATLLGWLVFRWARALYGSAAGLLALTLYVFDPNILAHGSLVTSDLYATWTIALAIWAFWRFLNHEGPGVWRAAAVGALCFALAQVAKYTAAYLVPILIGIALGHAGPALWAFARQGDWRGLGRRLGRAGAYGALYAAAFLLVVNLAYWGQRTLEPLAGSRLRSSQFRQVQAALAPMPGLRIPVPWAHVEGLDWVLHDERAQEWNVYLLGEMGKGGAVGRRFPEYYLVSWLYKEPIATQLLLLGALAVYALRVRRFDFRRNEWFLAAPVLFFAWYLTFVFRAQIGYRHAIVVLPMIFVFTGSLLSEAAALGRRTRWLAGGLLGYLVVSVLSYYWQTRASCWTRTTGTCAGTSGSIRRSCSSPTRPWRAPCSCAWSGTWGCTTSSSTAGCGRTSSRWATWPTGTSCSG
jgi:dolichyl-phosphate-mannose-protein mannosyltransferase